MAVSLPEMLRVKKCWVASELDVATVRDDHYPAVVDLETFVCLPKNGNRQRKVRSFVPYDSETRCAERLFKRTWREFRVELRANMLMNIMPCVFVRFRIWRGGILRVRSRWVMPSALKCADEADSQGCETLLW